MSRLFLLAGFDFFTKTICGRTHSVFCFLIAGGPLTVPEDVAAPLASWSLPGCDHPSSVRMLGRNPGPFHGAASGGLFASALGKWDGLKMQLLFVFIYFSCASFVGLFTKCVDLFVFVCAF